jgi:hypothetical protein
LLVIFGEGRAVTKIIQDKETIEPRHYLKQRSASLPWRIFERKSGTGVPPSVYMAPYPHHRERRLGSVLLPVPFTQNLVSIVLCQFKRVNGRSVAQRLVWP